MTAFIARAKHLIDDDACGIARAKHLVALHDPHYRSRESVYRVG
jgi:hypothetical protein